MTREDAPVSFVRRGRRYRDVDARSTRREDAREGNDAGEKESAPAVGFMLPGARASARGRALASSGHADVDALLGGGVPLGSVTCASSDGASGHAEATFGTYFLAEGAAEVGHRMCWVRGGMGGREEAMRLLPRRVEASVGDGEGEGGGEGGGDGLRIAWQYRRYLREGRALDDSRVGDGRSTVGRTSTSSSSKKKNLRAPDVCHAFDLTKEEDPETLARASVAFAPFRSASDAEEDDIGAWERCYEFVRSFVRSLGANEVGRVLVQPETPRDEREWVECAKLARALKMLMHGTNAATVLIVPLAGAPPRWSALIRHVVDCAIDVQPLDGPTSDIEALLPDPHTCVGLIAVRKLHFYGSVMSPLSRMDRVYALQMRRKRMAIRPLQFRPEEEKKSGGGAACSAVEGTGLDDF